jgi:ABC-type cobalamin transport system ATPase subunit
VAFRFPGRRRLLDAVSFTARQADRIHIIEKGKVLQNGDHESLLQSRNLYADAWRDLVEA